MLTPAELRALVMATLASHEPPVLSKLNTERRRVCDPIPQLPRRSGTMAAIAGFMVALESSSRPPMDYTTEAALRADQEGR